MSGDVRSPSWAKLRQVVIGTMHHDDDVAAVRASFGLGASFADPELHTLSLTDATFPLSSERYLEFVGPTGTTGPVASWLAKVGGRGGFVLSVQHPDAAGVRQRCIAKGVRVAIDTEAFGKPVLQLHPKDVGLVLEIDGITEPSVWFWDDINPGVEPSASVDEIIGVEVPVADPTAMTALWLELLDLGEASAPNEIDLGGAWVRFTPGGPSTNWTVVLHRSGDAAVDPGLAGVTFELV